MKHSNPLELFPSPEDQKALALRLGLRYENNMQDWEYEVSDHSRVDDFISEYYKPETTDIERISLLEIILDSLNEALNRDGLRSKKLPPLLNEVLETQSSIHAKTIEYWTNGDFAISPLLRRQ